MRQEGLLFSFPTYAVERGDYHILTMVHWLCYLCPLWGGMVAMFLLSGGLVTKFFVLQGRGGSVTKFCLRFQELLACQASS